MDLLDPTKTRGYAAVGLFDPKDPKNVGGVLRACGCYGAQLVAVQGTRYSPVRTDTQKTWRHTPLLQVDDLGDVVPYDCTPIFVDCFPHNPQARTLPAFTHPERAFYIFGPEDGSLKEEMTWWFNTTDQMVRVPTNHCMNLAATVNVVLYDRMSKLHSQEKVLP